MKERSESLRFIRPTVCEIDLDNLEYNYNIIRGLIKPRTKLLSVVKANAYGHGVAAISKKLVELGTDFLGAATVEEGIYLREEGIQDVPILILGSLYPYSSFKYIDSYNLTPTISSLILAKEFSKYAKSKNKIMPIHIKVDTGMARIGISSGRAVCDIKTICKLPNLNVEGVYTHIANAGNDSYATQDQIVDFFNISENLKPDCNVPYFHAANSETLFKYLNSEFDMVRIGLALYGMYEAEELKERFKPVMSLKTQIVFLKRVPRGTRVSYGSTYTTYRETVIATIPIGYADGYSRLLSNQSEGIIKGKRVRQIGTICMDMCMFDVTDVPNVELGDEIILIGESGKEEIKAEELARKTNTINYEITSQITGRVPRIIKN